MGWYSTWNIEFKPNSKGECIYDLWYQDEVDNLAEKQEHYHSVAFSYGEAEVSIKYGYSCEIVKDLYELYGCPMKIVCIEEDSGNDIDKESFYFPSQFEWEYDFEVEIMIKKVADREKMHNILDYNKNNYTRESRLELLAKTLFKLYQENYPLVWSINSKEK
jgi:hypothetical protein